ncbi:MAG TPA: endonuclease domain-containing protein [Ktedonobacterales bacterium]
MRECSSCRAVKDESEFYPVTQRGITHLRRICKECSRAQQRDHSNDPKPAGRVCTVCRKWKPLADFHRHKVCRYGVEPMCKLCKYLKRKERDLADPRRIRRLDLKAKYNLTLQDFDAMLAAQQGKCAICGVGDQKLVVDHNHVTGQVRRLLCHLCNAMIGCAREDPAILLAGAAYLRTHEAPATALSAPQRDVTQAAR